MPVTCNLSGTLKSKVETRNPVPSKKKKSIHGAFYLLLNRHFLSHWLWTQSWEKILACVVDGVWRSGQSASKGWVTFSNHHLHITFAFLGLISHHWLVTGNTGRRLFCAYWQMSEEGPEFTLSFSCVNKFTRLRIGCHGTLRTKAKKEGREECAHK